MADNSSFIHIIDDALKIAVFQRFDEYFGLTNIKNDIVFQPRSIQERKIAEKRGELSVEFIGLWRPHIAPDWSRQRTPLARDGIMLEYTDSNKTSIVTVKAVPAVLDYELRFWSRDLNSLTLATESYIKWMQDFPNLVVYYDDSYEMDFYLRFGDILDETDFNIYEKGLYYVHMMPIKLEGWVLTSIESKTILTIYLDVFLRQFISGQTEDILLSEYVITATS